MNPEEETQQSEPAEEKTVASENKNANEVFQEKVKEAGNTAVNVLRQVTSQLQGAETREEQEQATAAFAKSIASGTHVLLEAPTGTGKSIAYLLPAVLSGEKIVVSTATKQLSEQIINKDVPFLKKALLETDSPVKHFTAGLLKGRDNYYCLYKEAESSRLDEQYDDGEVKSSKYDANKIAVEMRYLKTWAAKTETGDRAEAPEIISDKVWRQYSSNSTECIGKNVCPFGASCFAEYARDKAKDADIVVTNHAMVAHDMISEASTLGERNVYIVDEVHEFDRYVTDAWSATLAPSSIRDAAKTLKNVESQVDLPDDEFSVSLFLNKTADTLKKALDLVDAGRIEAPQGVLKQLLNDLRVRCSQASAAVGKKITDKKGKEDDKGDFIMARNKLDSIIEAVDLLMSETSQIVRWISESGSKENPVRQLQAAPLRIGPTLQSKLQEKSITMVGTSATVRVGGSFEIPLHNLGFDLVPNVKTFALKSPFDFKKQAMLFIPDGNFPAPVGADRKEHGEAVKAYSYELIKAMNGRAMVLTTTSYGVRDISEYLRKKLPNNNIIAQGDMPNSQLVEKYREDEHSVLVATMGLWHGLDVSGSTSSLVIIDKIPFRPMNDPLFEARREYADASGRDGFNDVFVADANVMLTQGLGRLIRRKTDKGVVAILDTRLIDKKYGRDMIASFPPISIFRDKDKVVAACERLASMYDNADS